MKAQLNAVNIIEKQVAYVEKIRIFILLLILATVVQQTLQEDADLNWDKNFYVAVYPINADNSAIVSAYINTLSTQDFEPVAEFLRKKRNAINWVYVDI